jgi:PAS domain-containing protein
VRQALADGKEQSVEFRIMRPNGEVVWVLARGQVQHGKAGKPLRLIGILQDITERKRVEANSGRAGSGERAVTRTRRNPTKPDKLGAGN